jgi:hypothetical protein
MTPAASPLFRSPRLFAAAAMLLAGLAATPAHADGLSDLKAALARPQGSATLAGNFDVRLWRRQGEGKDMEESNGAAGVAIDDGPQGLRMFFSRDTLNRAQDEDRAKEKDGKAKTPTSSALVKLNSGELRDMTAAAQTLLRALEKAQFKSERNDTWSGKPARVLTFDLGVDKIAEKDRKYVKSFEGRLEVWLDADGTPLASKAHMHAKGSAFLVLSVDVDNDEDYVYAMAGERLVAVRKEVRTKSSGSGDKSEQRTTHTLTLRQPAA